MTSRRARRWAGAMVVGALALAIEAGAQTPAPGEQQPFEEPDHAFYLGVHSGDMNPYDAQRRLSAQSFGDAPDVREGLRLVVLRGEEELLDVTARYETRYGSSAWAEVDSTLEPQTGDRVEYYVPPGAEVAKRVVIWDGRPTLESCAVGATTVGGRANRRTQTLYVSVRSAGTSTSSESWAVTTLGDTWSATGSRPLGEGDMVMMSSIYQHDEHFSVTRSDDALAGQCRPPEEPGSGLVVFDGHDGLLDDLEGGDVVQDGDTVKVEVGCEAESAIACAGPLRVDTVSRYATASAKRKRLKLAAGKVAVAPGKRRWVRLKVRKAGRRLIERRRRVAALVTAAAADPSGAKRATSRKLTLKAKRRR